MNRPDGSDPIDELRRANPVLAEEVPSASLARVRARVLEETMTDIDAERSPRRFKVARPLALGAAAATAAMLLVAVVGRPASLPAGPSPSTGPIIGHCVETYSMETLRGRSFAFDGTLISVEPDRGTFAVNEAFHGVDVAEITLAAPGMTGTSITSGSGPTLTVGQRYLVAGDDQFVWACGFTQPYDPDVAADWAEAFRS